MGDSRSTVLKFRFDTSSMSYEKTAVKGVGGRLVRSFFDYRLKLIAFMAVTMLYCISYVQIPKLMGEIIDAYVAEILASLFTGESTLDWATVTPLLLEAGVAFVLNTAFAVIQGFIVSRIVTSYSCNLRNKVYAKLNRLPAMYMDTHAHSDILARVTGDVDALNQSLNLCLSRMITAGILFACVTAMLFTVDVYMSCISLAIVPACAVAIGIISHFEKSRAGERQRLAGALNAEIDELYLGLGTVCGSGNAASSLSRLGALGEESAAKSAKAGFVSALLPCVSELGVGLCIVAVSVLGAFRISEGDASIGALLTTVMYVRKLYQPVSQLSLFSSIMQTARFSAGRIFKFLDEPEESGAGVPSVLTAPAALELRHVTFAYPGAYDCVFKNVSAVINATGITAITGVTGAGKSTLVKLLLRFYSPQSGGIFCAGKNIAELSTDEYRKNFNVIMQDAGLFEASIAQNIAYGSKNVTQLQLREAARLAGADGFISALPQGYDTVFTPGAPNLSCGEIQLVLLARAFLSKAKYIIFDEATSFVDTKTEQQVMDTLALISRSSAVIIIAHRKSTLRLADKVLQISGGLIGQ